MPLVLARPKMLVLIGESHVSGNSVRALMRMIVAWFRPSPVGGLRVADYQEPT